MRIFLFGIVIISAGILSSCRAQGSKEMIPAPDREGFLLAEEKIKETDVYNEPEHLKKRLYASDATGRDLAAERLLSLNSRKANKIISEALKSDNEEAVKSVLKTLGSRKNERFIEEVIHILETGNPAFQPYIFSIFSNSETEMVAKIIIKYLNQPEKSEAIRQNLIRGLSFVPSKRSIPFLIGLLTGRKSEFNSEIINTLNIITRQRFNTKEEWTKWWMLNRNQPRERWLEQSIIEYNKQMEEKDKLIKQYAENIALVKVDILKMKLEQARRLTDATAEINLLTNALDDEFIIVKKYALEQVKALDQEKAKQMVSKLTELLKANKNHSTDASIDDFRLMVIIILGDLGDERAIEPLLIILNDPREADNLKNKAIIALGKIKNPKIIPHLLALIDTSPLETILIVVETIGGFGQEARLAVSRFYDILKSPKYQNEEKIIKAVIDAFDDIREPSSVVEILPFINDARPRVRWSASNTLGKIGVGDVAPQLVKLLNDEFMDIKQITIEALGKLGNKTICPEIIKVLLNDKDLRTRQLAADALGAIKDKTTLSSLLTVLNESDEKLTASVWNAILSITYDNFDLMEEIASKLKESKHLSYSNLMLKKIISNPQFKTKELEPRLLTNIGSLGLILTEMGDWNQAVQYLLEAEKYFSGKPEFTLALIECYKNLKQYDLASKSCMALLDDQKEDSSQWWSLKIELLSFYFSRKEYSKIIEEISKLLKRTAVPPEIKEKLEKMNIEAEKSLIVPNSSDNQPPNPK
ncbi:MAG: HEAT repeat domain-containing protein [Planctomycetota bacterium]